MSPKCEHSSNGHVDLWAEDGSVDLNQLEGAKSHGPPLDIRYCIDFEEE